MKKLSREQTKVKAKLSQNLDAAKTALEESAEKLNEAISAHNELVVKYNEAVDEAKQWCDEIVGEIEDYTSERSDKWQEGDAASALEEWKGQFEGFEPTEAEEVDEVEIDLECSLDDISEGVE